MQTRTRTGGSQLHFGYMLALMAALFALMLAPAVARANSKLISFNEAEVVDGKVQYSTNYILYDYSTVSSSETEEEVLWLTGKLVVQDESVTINGRITVSGDVQLILCDGATLTATQGITVAKGESLAVYAGKTGDSGDIQGTGRLFANCREGDTTNVASNHDFGAAGIGGENGFTGGELYVHGGNITAVGGALAAGIGGGNQGAGGQFTIYGGTVTATGNSEGSSGSAGIGSGGDTHATGGRVRIYGGTVTATGGYYGAGIGGGQGSNGADVIINGGTVTARGKGGGAGIGGGQGANGGKVTIKEGTIYAAADDGIYVEGIGHGYMGDSSGSLNFKSPDKLKLYCSSKEDYSDAYEYTDTPTRAKYMWTSYFYTVSFNANGGEGDPMPDMEVDVGDSCTLPVCTYTYPHGSFRNWNLSQDGTALSYQPGETFIPKKDTTLYVGWNKNVSSTGTVQTRRLYNPNSGEHFFTVSAGEHDALLSAGWKDEGTAWATPESSSEPLYRLYNKNGGDHHYTTSAGERDQLVDLGWTYEGLAWYADAYARMPVYRLYNPNAAIGAHHFTTSAGERDLLVSLGWRDEGIGFYGVV